MATLNRPSIAANALPAWIRYCPARTPAPKSTIFCTKSGAVGSFGRVARTSRATKSITKSPTGTLRTSFCKLMIAFPLSTL